MYQIQHQNAFLVTVQCAYANLISVKFIRLRLRGSVYLAGIRYIFRTGYEELVKQPCFRIPAYVFALYQRYR